MNKHIAEFPALISPTVEIFSEGLSGVVTKPISFYQPGRIKCQGIYWRAKLYQPDCRATILPGQPVIVIGRENLTYIVIPLHCPLQEKDANDFHAWSTRSDLENMQPYNNFWRN